LQLTDPRDSESIFRIGNTEAVDLGRYEFIYNAKSGDSGANIRAKAYPPLEISEVIQNAIVNKSSEDTLTPLLVQSSVEKVVEQKEAIVSEKEEREAYQNQYDTTDELAILTKLKSQGVIPSKIK
jgi:hypothetical protein